MALTWSPVSPPVTPPSLAYASAAYDSDNQTIVLFGGSHSNGTLSNDTWVWNGSTWTDFSGSAGQAPPARKSASMAFDPKLHQLILFGGDGANGQPLGDTWAWNGASWYEQSDQVLGQSPVPRGRGHWLRRRREPGPLRRYGLHRPASRPASRDHDVYDHQYNRSSP